ncbi:unnamed protein product, partial [Mesorhabditis spiculigera]
MSNPSASISATQASTATSDKTDGTHMKPVGAVTPSSSIYASLQKSNPRAVRFLTCVLVMLSVSGALLVCQSLLASRVPVLSLVPRLAILILAAFSYEWMWVHSRGLTRVRRAYFDEANVLETYQPRARAEGQFFQADPPTPGPNDGKVTFGEGTEDPDPSRNAQFNKARDAHYANEFLMAEKMAKEQNLFGAGAVDPGPPKGPLVPADLSNKKDDKKKAPRSGSFERV